MTEGRRTRGRVWPSNKALFTVHGWLGMSFGLLLAWVCLSRAIAAGRHEFQCLTKPALRSEADGATRWQATPDAVLEAYPEHWVVGLARDATAFIDALSNSATGGGDVSRATRMGITARQDGSARAPYRVVTSWQ